MDEHTLRLLEFGRIRAELAEDCFSAGGSELLSRQEILAEPEAVQELLGRSMQLRSLLEDGEGLPPLDFPDIGGLLPRLAKRGSVLEADELSWIGRYLASAEGLKRFLADRPESEGIGAIVASIPDTGPLRREIFRYVDKAGHLREKEIPELRSIAGRIAGARRSADRLIAGYLSDPAYSGYWRMDRPTIRDGRAVLALKSNFKGRIPGIVHEASSSGATVFVEPADVVEQNNRVVEEQQAYRREARRILRDLTAKVARDLGEIELTVERISYLDTLYARARYAGRHDCRAASFQEGVIRLRRARHPLLTGAVVPVTVELDSGLRVLVVTGPNTGGKTVTLKTVGLLCAMNQFGMEIPADEESALGVFDGVFADIGDEQSIEQSLSTFSSHIRTIGAVVGRSTRSSLVLLDELGAGTDPEEGVALAMALLDHFIDKGCFTLCTTHHGILKNYGYTRKGVQNASMEFDRRTLVPTYHMLVGIPGESHALEIAGREGMREDIVSRAVSYLEDERGDISELIRRLTEKQKELLESERSHRVRETELRERRRETDLMRLRLKQKEAELRDQGIRELRSFIDSSRKELDELIRDIREGQLSKAKTRRASEFLGNLRERLGEEEVRHEETLEEQREQEGDRGVPFEARAGMPVVVRSSGRRGRVVRKGRGERWVVQVGSLKVSLDKSDFDPAQDSGGARRVEVEAAPDLGETPSLELDVRGLRCEEAIARLERQIDNALVRGLAEFGVIHGKGEGVLQQGIHRYLEDQPSVREFFFSSPEQGGFGKTVVRLAT